MRKKVEIFFCDHFALKDVGFLVEIVHINFDQVLGVLPISEQNRLNKWFFVLNRCHLISCFFVACRKRKSYKQIFSKKEVFALKVLDSVFLRYRQFSLCFSVDKTGYIWLTLYLLFSLFPLVNVNFLSYRQLESILFQ